MLTFGLARYRCEPRGPDEPSKWIAAFGPPEGMALQLNVGAEIQRQAAMVGYINAFFLLALLAAAAAPMAVLFSTRKGA